MENQLERTDHAHLGQLLTYAGGTDALNIVWCAPSFHEAHRAALDWLNIRADENTRFFGVEIAMMRIDDSRPAPSSRLVAQPNDRSQQVHADSTDTAQRRKRLASSEFWSNLRDRIHTETGMDQCHTGSSGVVDHPALRILGQLVRNGVHRPRPRLRALLQITRCRHKHRQLGGEVSLQPLPDKKACRIAICLPGADVTNTSERSVYTEWLIGKQARFRNAIEVARAAHRRRSPGHGLSITEALQRPDQQSPGTHPAGRDGSAANPTKGTMLKPTAA